jgi:hypothetical protein
MMTTDLFVIANVKELCVKLVIYHSWTDILFTSFPFKLRTVMPFFVGYNHSTGECTQTATAITYQ